MIKDNHKGILAAISANVIFGLNIPVTKSLVAHWMTPMGYTISRMFFGTVGTFGGSYMGGTQWLPAGAQPPALRAMTPAVTFSDGYEGCSYQGGAKVLHDLRWVVADIVPAEINRRIAGGENLPNSEIPLDVDTALTELPLVTHPLIRKYAAFYLDWLAHSTADDYWLPSSPKAGYKQIRVPALNISGWYDIFLWSTFQNYMGMKQQGATKEARRNQHLIIGPWSHMNFSGSFPEREFGWRGSSAAIDLPGIHLVWFFPSSLTKQDNYES